MKIQVKKATLPTIDGVQVFVSYKSTSTVSADHAFWSKAEWNNEKQAFICKESYGDIVRHPASIVEWHYYTDKLPYDQRPKKAATQVEADQPMPTE